MKIVLSIIIILLPIVGITQDASISTTSTTIKRGIDLSIEYNRILDDNKTLRKEIENKEVTIKVLKDKLSELVISYKAQVESAPVVNSFRDGRINFTIHEVKYSLSLPDPSKGFLNGMELSIGYQTPTFTNFNFSNSRMTLGIGYNIFGFRVWSDYDFVNDWKFSVSFNLIKLIDLF